MGEIEQLEELGFTHNQMVRFLPPAEFQRFIFWMRGQTCGVVNGEPVYYYYDVRRFLKIK